MCVTRKQGQVSCLNLTRTSQLLLVGVKYLSSYCFLRHKEIQLGRNQKFNNLSLAWFLMWFDNWIDPFAEANAEDSGAGTKEYVHVRVQQRNGRKSLTTVQGLKKEYSYSKILKDLKKEFCCNGTVVQDPELGQVCLFSSSQIMHNVIILFCNCRSLK